MVLLAFPAIDRKNSCKLSYIIIVKKFVFLANFLLKTRATAGMFPGGRRIINTKLTSNLHRLVYI